MSFSYKPLILIIYFIFTCPPHRSDHRKIYRRRFFGAAFSRTPLPAVVTVGEFGAGFPVQRITDVLGNDDLALGR